MREMRDRAAILYVTVGPSGLGTPVNVDHNGFAPDLRLVEPLPEAVNWARWSAGPRKETDSMRKYRENFSPKPAKRPPTTRFGRAMTMLSTWFLRDL